MHKKKYYVNVTVINENKGVLVWMFALAWIQPLEPSRGSMMVGADWLSWPDWATVTRRAEDTEEEDGIFLGCLLKTKRTVILKLKNIHLR